MGDLRITLELFGDTQLDREMRFIGRQAGDLKPAFKAVFDQMVDINSKQFWSLGARSGHPWAPLKPATVIQKAREGSPTPEIALRRFGDLFDAMSFIPNENNRVTYQRHAAHFMLTGQPGRIGAIHQRGSAAANIPARPFFKLTERDRKDFVDEIAHFIFKRKVRNFL